MELWVHSGGGLLVVADHMPMAGAVQGLAASFGVRVLDGFVLNEDQLNPSGTLDDFDAGGWVKFGRVSGGLATHPITEGRSNAERIEYLTTDVGGAFKLPPSLVSLVTLGPGAVSLMPETAWSFAPETRREGVEGWSQAAAGCVGKGRVVLLADVWPFMAGPNFDNVAQESAAQYHPQFTLNLMNWLAGRLPCS